MSTEPGQVQTAQGEPFSQLRNERWQGEYYEEGKTSLRCCFDVHLELQLSNEDVRFRLHFETNPYMSNLKNKVPTAELENHRKQCENFANALTNHKEDYWSPLHSAGWKLTKQYANQRATCGNFELDRDVGDFRQWVEDRAQAIIPLIERAGESAELWK